MLLGTRELTPLAASLATAGPLAAVAGSVRLVLAGIVPVPVRGQTPLR